MKTYHSIHIGASQQMASTGDETIDLVVTSPPYPMVEMWDEIMAKQNPAIAENLKKCPAFAFELMHDELDKVWKECFRVLKVGGFLCINIGDATRTINGNFRLYDNHSRISKTCIDLGFVSLPNIIWHKQTNAPNKFMGSGMLPCGAYVTLEHEWILIFRKGDKREYKNDVDRHGRLRSSFFWEERNTWFSDIWDIKGIKQKMHKTSTRERSAAYPFEVPYRLINMFSQKDDTVLDPFLGTGTTIQAAMLLGRNSCGYDIDPNFKSVVQEGIDAMKLERCNEIIKQRFDAHKEFIANRKASGKEIKHFNDALNCEVMTTQEKEIEFNYLGSIKFENDKVGYVVEYEEHSDLSGLPLKEVRSKAESRDVNNT